VNAVERLQRRFLQSLEEGFGEPEWNRSPDRLYAPQRYILGMGGKRLRPVLSLMAAEAMGGDASLALPAAHAVERFHNFSLIHDDIMDEAPVRRGQPTVHQSWGQNTAILSGDALLVMAYSALEKLPPAILPEALKVFNRTALEVCEGQQWDMDFETTEEVNEGQYLQMIRNKTSVLLGCALELGALSAGGSKEIARALYAFGLELGTSFQIHDDILDAFGDPTLVGKQVGGDIRSNKKTLLYIHLANAAPDVLSQWSSDRSDEKVDQIKKAMQSVGTDLYAEEKRKAHFDAAMEALTQAQALGCNTEDLAALAQWIYTRVS
jgi:geranylgeranyl diphosphate synthase, type II